MSEPCEDICDALAAALNAAQDPDESSDEENPFSLTFKAENVEDPNAELVKQSDAMRVLLWPHASTAQKIGGRGIVLETHSVAMLVLRKTGVEFPRKRISGVDREIILFIRGKKMAGKTWSGEEASKFDLEHMHENKRVECSTIITYTGTA